VQTQHCNTGCTPHTGYTSAQRNHALTSSTNPFMTSSPVNSASSPSTNVITPHSYTGWRWLTISPIIMHLIFMWPSLNSQMGLDFIARSISDNGWAEGNVTTHFDQGDFLSTLRVCSMFDILQSSMFPWQGIVLTSPQYLHCEWYSLYVVQWDRGTPSLRRYGLCNEDENKKLLPIDVFPNCGQGFNGRTLTVYTMVVREVVFQQWNQLKFFYKTVATVCDWKWETGPKWPLLRDLHGHVTRTGQDTQFHVRIFIDEICNSHFSALVDILWAFQKTDNMASCRGMATGLDWLGQCRERLVIWIKGLAFCIFHIFKISRILHV
jgi:hypothetical protein